MAHADCGPHPVDLSEPERSALESGQVVYRKELGQDGSSGLSMVLVDAPPQQVWGVILDFDAYVEFLPYVTSSWTEPRRPEDSPDLHHWGMELTTRGVVTRYAATTVMAPSGCDATWEMVPTGYSPMSKARGWWRTQPWGDGRTLLIYSADVETSWWLPSVVHQKAADRGLPAMVVLVGRRAERGQARRTPE
jgi:ribosome-associated toxin RatA of RatAB toxin-antitoxin module